jgi:hypothetical protein
MTNLFTLSGAKFSSKVPMGRWEVAAIALVAPVPLNELSHIYIIIQFQASL